MTAGVNRKGPEFVAKALARVIAFDDFNADNDPHRDHDFGSYELEGEKLFWKIDSYERELVKRRWIENGSRTTKPARSVYPERANVGIAELADIGR